MITQIIYDDTGFIISQMQSSDLREPVGIPFLMVEIPEDKYLIGVDVSVTPNVPVYEDLPKSETQLLQEQVNDLNLAMAALMGGAV